MLRGGAELYGVWLSTLSTYAKQVSNGRSKGNPHPENCRYEVLLRVLPAYVMAYGFRQCSLLVSKIRVRSSRTFSIIL